MKIRRNKVSVRPIENLPEDVLYKIFCDIASDITVLHERLICTLSNSWVCQKWRRIILESPVIWGQLLFFTLKQSFIPAALVSTILERSGKHSPLWIVGDTSSFSSEDTEPSRETIAASDALVPIMRRISTEHWDRVEGIMISVCHSKLSFVGPSFFAALIERPARQLRHIHLVAPNSSVGQVGAQPPSFFNGCSPVLGYFAVTGLRYTLPPSSLAHLRSLEFHDHIKGNTLHLLPQEFPLLECCIIHGDVSGTLDERNLVPIRLPKLRLLHVIGSPEACQVIIRNTDRSSPEGCFVGFKLEIPEDHSLCSYGQPSKFVQGFYEPHLLNNLELMKRSGLRLEEITLSMYTNAFEIQLPTGPDYPAAMSLFFDSMHCSSFYSPVVKSLTRLAVFFKDVHTLRLDSYFGTIMGRSQLQRCLRVFPNVTTVRTIYMNHVPFVYTYAHGLGGDIKSWSDEQKAEFVRSQPFPKLRKLNYCQDPTVDPALEMLPALLDNLKERATLGMPIEEIELVTMPERFVMPKELARVAREFPDLKIWLMSEDSSCDDRKMLSGCFEARARTLARNMSERMRQSVAQTEIPPVLVQSLRHGLGPALLEWQLKENEQHRMLNLSYRALRESIVAAQAGMVKELEVHDDNQVMRTMVEEFRRT
ncbi:hypothetical protein CPC08DRAFT_788480 [Agrocybe pediades]|nr:hypothetical protein CPC08DRAFT_788480 [Agrocybe pediades]